MITYHVNADEKVKALYHIFYEIHQLAAVATATSDDEVWNCALLESRLLHARNLLDFFQRSKRSIRNGQELDDILSTDYDFGPTPSIVSSTVSDRLNKELAHLTFSRNRRLEADRWWSNSLVVSPVLRVGGDFIDHLLGTRQYEGGVRSGAEWQELKQQVVLAASAADISGRT